MNPYCVLKIFSTRKEQLDKQEVIDNELSKLDCHRDVLKYLFLSRELNRKLTNEYSKEHFWNYISIATKHISLMEKETEHIQNLLESTTCKCLNLRDYNEILRKKLE